MELYDYFPLDDAANVRITATGGLVAMPRVARTGVQLYRGKEVGRPEMDVVRVYRPEDQVFHKDSLATYPYKTVTNDHPPQPIDAKNWRQYAVGNMGETVARDGEFIRVPMLVMDEKAIKDYKDGKAELSVGYSTELKWDKGVAPNGEAYDAIQTDIRVNHVAIVDAARGGSKLRIGDYSALQASTPAADADADDEGADDMSDAKTALPLVTCMVDSIALSMDSTAAAIVTKSLKDLNDKLNATTAQITTLTGDAAKAKSDHEAAIAKLTTDHATALAAKDAEIATLKKQVEDSTLSPEKIEAMVKDRAEMLGKAKSILGDKLVVDKKSDTEIRRQVVDAKLGEAAKGWSDDQIKVSFDTLTAGIKTETAPAITDMRQAFQSPAQMNDKAAMYGKADKALSERWKNPGGATAAKH